MGCESEAPIQRVVSVSDTTKQFLNALRVQDGLTMAELTVSREGFDFTISESDAQAIGMGQVQAQRFYKQIWKFEYSLGSETVNEDHAQIKAYIHAYDIEAILNETVAANQEVFASIDEENISEEEKNAKVADILIQAFTSQEKTYQFEIIFHLQRIDGVWLIENEDALTFVNTLFTQPKEEG